MRTPRRSFEGTDTPAPAAAPSFGSGKFSFQPKKVATVPEAPTRGGLPKNALWFRDWFTYCATLGDEAHGQTIYVPDSFWTAPKEEGGRGLEALPKPDYTRSKFRESFKTWQKDSEHAEAREKFGLVVIQRKQGQDTGEGDEKYPEDGFSMFFTDKTRA